MKIKLDHLKYCILIRSEIKIVHVFSIHLINISHFPWLEQVNDSEMIEIVAGLLTLNMENLTESLRRIRENITIPNEG